MTARIAIVSAEGSLLLEALLDAWESSLLSAMTISLVSPSANEGETVMYAGQALRFTDIAKFDFAQVDCVIVLASSIVVEAYKEVLLNVSCPILGFLDGLAPLGSVVFNKAAPSDAKCLGVLQAPVAALEYVLEGLNCESLDATVLYPVSLYGASGVQELAKQTTQLLNVQAFDSHLFGQQMPFNYFPLSANILGAETEKQLFVESVHAFPDLDVHVNAIQMPVFYGITVLVSVVCDDEVNIAGFIESCVQKKLISYQDSDKQLSNMEAIGENGNIIVGRLRKSGTDPYRMDFWIGLDDVKFSASYSLISAAEFLLKHHL